MGIAEKEMHLCVLIVEHSSTISAKPWTIHIQEAQGPWGSAWSLARQEKVRFKCLPGMKLLGNS